MTKKFKQTIHCPSCGHEHTVETAWSRWVREQEELKPKDGHVFCDIDLFPHLYIAHAYKTKNYGRELQFMMFIEVKIHGVEPSASQRDTLNILGQIVRNRKTTPEKNKIYKQMSPGLNEAFSTILNKDVRLKLYGAHLLQFSGTGPEDSDKILWNRKQINKAQLIKLLKFELDPDSLRSIDLRIHHKEENPSLFKIKED